MYGIVIYSESCPFNKDNIVFSNNDKDIVAYLKNNCKDGDKVWVNQGFEYTQASGELGWKTGAPLCWQRPYQEVVDMFDDDDDDVPESYEEFLKDEQRAMIRN